MAAIMTAASPVRTAPPTIGRREGEAAMVTSGPVVVGLDNGGTANNATVLDASGAFLVDRLVETPSLVREGPDVAVGALVRAIENILDLTGLQRAQVRGVGLD